jgi:hypothetical protein
VHQTLTFQRPSRAPRDLWVLPIAIAEHPLTYEELRRDFPSDFASACGYEKEQAPTVGDPHGVGLYTDAWGATFTNIRPGIIGEVKTAAIVDWDDYLACVHIPREWLTIQRDHINRDCAATDKFVFGGCCPRPFEQMQFLRGSANLYMDLADPPPAMKAFMAEMHAFYCQLLEAWAQTDVDALNFMDDWGSQRSLLISPAMWRDLFKPMYRDYVEIAHAAGKKIFMHSDGHILSIYGDLVEIGVDAVNSQLFCMGIDKVAEYAGRITFWGEIDRQHLLARATPEEVEKAVEEVHAALWRDGGCIAQCEFGAGARPENVRSVYTTWNQLTS